MLNLLIQLALLFYFVLYPVWFTSPPQDPTIRSSAAQRTAGTFVPVLGSTPSAAALLVSYARAQRPIFTASKLRLVLKYLTVLHPVMQNTTCNRIYGNSLGKDFLAGHKTLSAKSYQTSKQRQNHFSCELRNKNSHTRASRTFYLDNWTRNARVT